MNRSSTEPRLWLGCYLTLENISRRRTMFFAGFRFMFSTEPRQTSFPKRNKSPKRWKKHIERPVISYIIWEITMSFIGKSWIHPWIMVHSYVTNDQRFHLEFLHQSIQEWTRFVTHVQQPLHWGDHNSWPGNRSKLVPQCNAAIYNIIYIIIYIYIIKYYNIYIIKYYILCIIY